MAYVVKFVDDDRMPVGNHWALVRDGEDFYFIAKRGKVSPLVLAEGWAAYCSSIQAEMPRPLLAAVC